jgi:glycosyltransferase involved in cell wall biosynthesis
MKVLIINNEFPPVGGGAGRSSYYLARELDKLGVEVSVLTASSQEPMDLPALPNVKIHRVFSWRKSIHEAGKRGLGMFLLLGALHFLLLRPGQYDIIIYAASIPAGLISIFAPRHASIMQLHGLDVPGRDDSFQLVHTLLKPINLATWRWSDIVTANSANLAASAKKHAPDLPLPIIYYGIDTETFRPGPARPATKPFRVIGISRLIKLKGFQYLIQAMKDLPAEEFQLTIVGKGSYEPELQALTDDLGLRDRITFAGFHSHEALPGYLHDADLFVLPSYGDSYASAFLEAMACGIPVIGAAAGGACELIRHGENGWLVPPHDSTAITEAVRTLAAGETLRCRMAQTALEEVHRERSWTAYGKNHYELCQQVLARRANR